MEEIHAVIVYRYIQYRHSDSITNVDIYINDIENLRDYQCWT
jgi:hypothetical protein